MNRIASVVIALVVVLGVASGAVAFIESPRHPPEAFTLSWVRQHAWIAVFKVDQVDANRGVVLYELTEQLQGKACPKRVRHLVQLNGKVLPGLDRLAAGQVAICFGSQEKLVITYVQGSWYLSVSDKGDASVWRTIQQRPDLNCLFVGPAADLADAFRELAAGREVMVRCQKGLKAAPTQFVRCRPAKTDQEKRELKRGEPVAAMQAVADNLPADPAADPKKAVPALVQALRSEDPLVRATAAKLLKQIDPEAAKKAAEPAQPAKARMKLYVTSSTGDSIHVIDLGSLKVVGEIKTAEHPHGAAVSADGKRLFCSVESDHTLLVIDTATDRIMKSIKLTQKPNQCAVTPDGKFVGVPIRGGDSVDIVAVEEGKVVKNLPVKVPHNCYNAGRNDRIFVTSMGENLVRLIDLKTLAYAAEIPVGGVPRPLAVTRDEKTLYCALSDLHGFVIADIAKRKVIDKVELPALPAGAKLPVPNTPTHGLELTPDEKELWVTSCATDTLYVYDTQAKKLVGKVGVGQGPNWVTFSPDGKYCCVSNVLSHDVSILDCTKRAEVARLTVGKHPKRLVVAAVP